MRKTWYISKISKSRNKNILLPSFHFIPFLSCSVRHMVSESSVKSGEWYVFRSEQLRCVVFSFLNFLKKTKKFLLQNHYIWSTEYSYKMIQVLSFIRTYMPQTFPWQSIEMSKSPLKLSAALCKMADESLDRFSNMTNYIMIPTPGYLSRKDDR